MERKRTYIAIDLKSFYASVECQFRSLDPMRTNLVVADTSRSEKTICLAVSPSLKAYGIPGRARLFEVISKVKEVNAERLLHAPNHQFTGKSFDALELKENPSLELSFLAATPQMKKYIEVSTKIYHTYLNYISPEDIHVYSIDEVFIDATEYLTLYQMTGRELCEMLIKNLFFETGITATGGIGTNLYLSKVAMDIVAKHVPANEHGVRIAELDERRYKELLWDHMPLTDFWRVGSGIQRKLHQYHLFTMGDIARCSLGKPNEFYNEDLLYKLFGINAELLIDHAWGYEPTTIKDIKAYKPESKSISNGQVLFHPYTTKNARVIIHEMADVLSLNLVEKKLKTNQLVISVGYEKSEKHAHGSINFDSYTSSSTKIIEKALALYDSIIDPTELVRRVYITATHVEPESKVMEKENFFQFDLFTDYDELNQKKEEEKEKDKEERALQEALLDIQKRFGKNAILKGTNFEEGATTRDRNTQIGGHKA